jgi:hypothetical protein
MAYTAQTGSEPEIPFTTLEQQLARERDQVFDKLDDGSRYMSRFLRGDRTPNSTTLDRFDGEFPGTREVFENGPYGSHLWSAISLREEESAGALRDRISNDIRAGVRIEYPVTVLGAHAVQDALVPASLAQRMGIDGTDLETASRGFNRYCTENPDLRHRIAPIVGAFAQYGEGAQITVQPGVTYSPDQRGRAHLSVTAPALTGLSLQLLEARLRGLNDETLLLARQREVEWHLERFGLSLDNVERVTGFRFYRLVILPPRRLSPIEQAGPDGK